jgi:hypothetical protein
MRIRLRGKPVQRGKRNGHAHATHDLFATHHLYFMFIYLFYTHGLIFNYLFRLCLHLHLLHLSLIRGRLRSRSGFIPQNRIENMTANAPAMTNTSPIGISWARVGSLFG